MMHTKTDRIEGTGDVPPIAGANQSFLTESQILPAHTQIQ